MREFLSFVASSLLISLGMILRGAVVIPLKLIALPIENLTHWLADVAEEITLPYNEE